MAITIIIKEGSADRRRRIYERGNPLRGPIEGRTKSVDEAHDIAYHQHGEQREAFLVEGDVPEMRQAHEDSVARLAARTGIPIDPDREYRAWQQQTQNPR